MPSRLKRSMSSERGKSSLSSLGDQPRRAMKLTTAAGRKPRSGYSWTAAPLSRLDILEPSAFMMRGMWA